MGRQKESKILSVYRLCYITNFEPTLLVKCVIEVKISTFSPFQDIYSYNYIEFLSKYREMHDTGQKLKNLSLWKSLNLTLKLQLWNTHGNFFMEL